MIETSTAYSSATKKYAYEAAQKAIKDYLKRNKIKGEVEHGSSLGFFRVKREILGNPLVSIIIPFKDKPNILEQCLNSILSKTEYKNYEIILVNNQSKAKKTVKYLQSLKKEKKIRILDYDKPFNFSAINNFAVEKSKGEYILFLNNDTEVINGNWLSNMLRHAQRKEVGVVGSLLLYPNNTIQHAGVVIGMGGTAGHVFHGVSINNDSYVDLMKIDRNYSAVTGACLMTQKELYLSVGGFDEKNFSIAFNDVDLCLKMREKDLLVVFTPYSKLYHYESLSRGYDEEMKQKNPER